MFRVYFLNSLTSDWFQGTNDDDCGTYIVFLFSFSSWCLRDPSKGFFCYAQGSSTHFFCVASFLWTTTIAFTLHRTVVRHKTDVEDLGPVFHLYVWGMHYVHSWADKFYIDAYLPTSAQPKNFSQWNSIPRFVVWAFCYTISIDETWFSFFFILI